MGLTSTAVDPSNPADQESGSEEEEDEESASEAPTLRSATVATAPPAPSPPSTNQAESSSDETATAVAESEPPATAQTESLAGNVTDHDDPDFLNEPTCPLGGPPQGYPPVTIDLLVNAAETSTTHHLPPLADIPTVARSAAHPSPLPEDATENQAPEADPEGPSSKTESSVQPIIAKSKNTSSEQILSDHEVPLPSASVQNDLPAASSPTTLVEGAPSPIDEAIPVSAAVFPNKDLINEAAPPADLAVQGQNSEQPVIELPCFSDAPDLKWFINPSPKFISFLSFKKILSNRPLNHPVPSDVFSNDFVLGLVPSSYFCSRNVSGYMMGS